MAITTSMPVLIVDDYPTMRRIVRRLLTQLGFTDVEEATDGGTALERLRQRAFGLVISEWKMAPMSGLQLLQAMRGDAKLRTLPFIMVTSEDEPDTPAVAAAAGASDCIVKPYNAAMLRRKMESAIGAS
jgi:two-component system chemotaxis response regulator CheY